MRKNFLSILTISTVIFVLSAVAFAQDSRAVSAAGSLYLISADAGGVNYVEGKVAVKQNNGRNGYLIKGDKLEVGEKVSTGAEGKAEILLNPGSYVRLAENSEFEFKTTSLDDLQLKLNRGSAMFEVITDDDFSFAVNTPKGKFYVVKSGVYRVDVLGDGSGKIAVWKGKAQVGNLEATEIKSGREATVNGNQVAVRKFDRDDKDALEAWSKIRAKELAKVNSRLERNNLRNTLVNSFNRNGWSLYDSYGLWVFDRFSGNYCFLPFGYGWSSPYGYGFGRDIWYLRLPRFIYYQPPTGGQQLPAATLNPATGKIRSNQSAVPPFQKVQNDVGRAPVESDVTPALFPSQNFPRTSAPSSPPPAVLTSPTGPGRKGDN
ncbi:MAG: FecR domain-containing protein [Acidobacteria bacterium]|nr:FecR domain-containing protein [Acidobacteriota bacterium]